MPLKGFTRRKALLGMAALAALAGCGPVAGTGAPSASSSAAATRLFSVLSRRAGLSREEFRRRWLGHNGRLASALDGLAGLVFSEGFGPGTDAAPASPWPAPVDGFVQAWAEEAEVLETMLASAAGKAWQNDLASLIDPDASRSYILREVTIIEPPRIEAGIKRTVLLVRRPDLSHQQFLDHWLSRHAELALGVPGLTGAVFNPILSEPGGQSDPWREFDGITETWWETGPDNLGGKPPSPQADAWLADADEFVDLPRSRTISSIEHVLIAPAR